MTYHRFIAAALQAGVAVLFLALPVDASPPPQAQCQFVLGFAQLRVLIPAQVGECLDDQQSSADSGDAVQHTAGGLLAWRKADNWTAFTDGYRTWINGPEGIQVRLNTQRFSWEADAAISDLLRASEITARLAAVRRLQENVRYETELEVTGAAPGESLKVALSYDERQCAIDCAFLVHGTWGPVDAGEADASGALRFVDRHPPYARYSYTFADMAGNIVVVGGGDDLARGY